MTANDLIWLSVAAGAMLCAALLGLLVAVEFLPRLLGREESFAEPRRAKPRVPAQSSRAAEPLVSIPDLKPRGILAMTPKAEPVRRAQPPPAPLLPPKAVVTKRPAPGMVIGPAKAAAPQKQPAYNLNFDEGRFGGEAGTDLSDVDEEADLPTVSIDRSQFEAAYGEFALQDRD